MLALITFANGDLTALDFGEPLEPAHTVEEQVRSILSVYPERRAELFAIGISPSLEALIHILDTAGREPSSILAPIAALGFMGRPQGAAAVARHRDHPDPRVRLAVIRGLGQMGKFDTILLVENALGSPIKEERRQAVIALGKFAKPELIPQIDRAASRDPDFAPLAQQAKARITATVEGIKTEDYSAFVNAVIDTPEYEDILPLMLFTWRPVMAIMKDPARSAEIRERAMKLLAMARVRKSGGAMRRFLNDPQQPYSIRLQAAYGLGMTHTRSSLRQLAALLATSDRALLEAAIWSLGQLGEAAALPPMVEHWPQIPLDLRKHLRLAMVRVAATPSLTSLLNPLRAYQPRPVAKLVFVTDSLQLIAGFRLDILAPYLAHSSAPARRDALLLTANLATAAQAGVLRRAAAEDPDPLNAEIARFGLERFKNIPLWERE